MTSDEFLTELRAEIVRLEAERAEQIERWTAAIERSANQRPSPATSRHRGVLESYLRAAEHHGSPALELHQRSLEEIERLAETRDLALNLIRSISPAPVSDDVDEDVHSFLARHGLNATLRALTVELDHTEVPG